MVWGRSIVDSTASHKGSNEIAASVILRAESALPVPVGEIGRILKVTESRVCQIHTKAVLQLKGKLESLQ